MNPIRATLVLLLVLVVTAPAAPPHRASTAFPMHRTSAGSAVEVAQILAGRAAFGPAAGLVANGRPAVRHAGRAFAASGGWRWPLAGTPRPVRLFDPPPEPWSAGHRGVDLAAEPGTPVLAVASGTVVYAGRLAGRGVVSIDHAGGLRTTYEPVDATVRAGAEVAAGQALGTLAAGHPGCPAAACLHWGLRRGPEYLDPLTVLGLGRVRLLPTSAAAPAGPRRAARTRRRGCRSAR